MPLSLGKSHVAQEFTVKGVVSIGIKKKWKAEGLVLLGN
jgi:hypothetical protein